MKDRRESQAEALAAAGDLKGAERLTSALLAEGHRAATIRYLHSSILLLQRRYDEAEPILEELRTQAPDDPGVLNSLGIVALERYQDWKRAEQLFARVVALDPHHVLALCNLGNAYLKQARHDEAAATYQRVLALDPRNVNALVNLGALSKRRADFDAALGYYRQAYAIAPRDLNVLRNLLITVHYSVGDDREALKLIDEIMALPHAGTALLAVYPLAKNYCLWEVQDRILDEVVAMALRGQADGLGMEMILLNLLAEPRVPLATLFELHKVLGRMLRRELQFAPFEEYAPAGPRLRIGYLSGDFRAHAVHRFLKEIISRYDRSRFEVVCYSTVNPAVYDQVTYEYQQAVDAFVDVSSMSVADLAARIHADGINVLVSLTGYTGGARMGVTCYRPAPVQITYLGYPYTTGLEEMDFIISDPYLDGPGNRGHFTEQMLPLPRSFLAHEYFDVDGRSAEGPQARNGYVTFGTLNNAYKFNRPVIAAWAAILKKVPASRLVLNSPRLKTPETRAQIAAEFGRHGIAAERIDFIWGKHPSGSHLPFYNDIDIALDTFPVTGGTTTVDAVMMGVPVVTLAGEIYFQRVSFSVLSGCGVDVSDLVAGDVDQYVENAVRLAADPARRVALRRRLLEAVPRSELCDTAGFARAMEAAYLSAWETRCGRRAAPDPAVARAEALLRRGDAAAAEALLAPLRTEGGDGRLEVLYGVALVQQRKFTAAEPVVRRLMQCSADDPDVLNAAGMIALDHQRDWIQAGQLFARVLELRPDDPVALINLGNVHFHLGGFDEAAAIYDKVAALADGPIRVNALMNAGAVATRQARFDQALACYGRAYAFAPTDPRVLGGLLAANQHPGGDEGEIARLMDEILALPRPGAALLAVYPLAKQRCRWDVLDRIRAQVKEICLAGAADPVELERVALNALADSAMSPSDLFGIHKRLADRLREQMQGLPFTGYQRRAGRLRIGYLSGDLRAHAVHKFLREIISRYDRNRFEVCCYSTLPPPLYDEVTREYQRSVDAFVDVSAMPTRAIADRIHSDGIDVLVNLAGYTRESRMELTCYRAAPVQISYLGYPFTSGMEEMDFVISDAALETEAGRPLFTERMLRLPRLYIAHEYPDVPGRSAEGPRSRNGFVTFGSLNAPYKIDRPVVAAWAAILSRVPEARLVLNHPQLASVETRAAITAGFEVHGITPERVQFVWERHPGGNHLAHYNAIDVALDTFPVTGGTTTVDALLMGVPVVTLAGEIYYRRISFAVLSGCGTEVSELIAEDVDGYVEKAVRLATDPARLTGLRHRLLDSVPGSELCDVVGFARAMEAAYVEACRIKEQEVRLETLEGLLGTLAGEGCQVTVAGAGEPFRLEVAGRGAKIAFAEAPLAGDVVVTFGNTASLAGSRAWRYLPALHRLIPAAGGDGEAVGPVSVWLSPMAEELLRDRQFLWEPDASGEVALDADSARWAALLSREGGPFGEGLVQAWVRTMRQHPEWEVFSAALHAYATAWDHDASTPSRLAQLERCNELLLLLAQGAPTPARLAVLLRVSLELGLWAQATTVAAYLDQWFASQPFVPDEPLVPFPGAPVAAGPAELGPAVARWVRAAREALERLGVGADQA